MKYIKKMKFKIVHSHEGYKYFYYDIYYGLMNKNLCDEEKIIIIHQRW
jgi:hypothetical protein